MRQSAQEKLAKICTLKDIPILEKAWKKAGGAEQRLRLYSILINLKWIPPKKLAVIMRHFKLLESPDNSIRQGAVIKILTIINGEHKLKQLLKTMGPGKIKLTVKINKNVIRQSESARLFFQIKNIDKFGFFIHKRNFSGKLRLEFSTGSLVYKTLPCFNFLGTGLTNEIKNFIFLKPGQTINLEQKFENTERLGLVSITGYYRNSRQYFIVYKRLLNNFDNVYQKIFPILAWRGNLPTEKPAAYYSLLPAKQIQAGHILAEIREGGINFINYSNKQQNINFVRLIRIYNGTIKKLKPGQIKIQPRAEKLLRLTHPNAGTLQYQFIIDDGSSCIQGSTDIKP